MTNNKKCDIKKIELKVKKAVEKTIRPKIIEDGALDLIAPYNEIEAKEEIKNVEKELKEIENELKKYKMI